MIIRVISNEGKEEVFEKENPITVEELMKGERITSGYPILGCLVNNEYERLDKVLDKDCTVRLCDIRDSYTNMSYQYSLSSLPLCHSSVMWKSGSTDVQFSFQRTVHKNKRSEPY